MTEQIAHFGWFPQKNAFSLFGPLKTLNIGSISDVQDRSQRSKDEFPLATEPILRIFRLASCRSSLGVRQRLAEIMWR